MLPNMNKKQMQKMMDQMGMEQEEVPADKVIIRKGNEEIVITDPDVAKVNMMGKETWQVTGGNAQARTVEAEVDVTDEDIQTVVDQAGVSEAEAERAIKEQDGDLTDAIMVLQK